MAYAPYIEPVLPAQTGSILKIPYEPSRGMSVDTIPAYARIMDIDSSLIEIITEGTANKGIANYTLSKSLEIGQQYKIQISYDDLVYSYVGVFKYTTPGTLNLENEFYPLTIIYDLNEKDLTETAARYMFKIYDSSKELVESSGWISKNTYYPKYNLAIGDAEVFCYVETINGLEVPGSKEFSYPAQEEVKYIYDNVLGACRIKSGCYRAEESGAKFAPILNFKGPSIDYTLEQGVTYKYGNTEVTPDFEDMFLSDASGYCLPIKFDPKVSSFKTAILESRQETIGGQFPIFFRNTSTKYHTFPINGLITRLMRPNDLPEEIRTKTNSDSVKITDFSTSLTGRNIAAERKFKREVLDWLNNGEPKLFRSPTEGNFIVRLMDISLTPNDTLGRMLHSFSCTAYECEEYTGENLQKFIVEVPNANT